MARVYFSFHYTADRDRARAAAERWLREPGADATAFIPRPVIERMIQAGVPAIYRWIDEAIRMADATVVLVGAATAGRHFVEYELASTIRQGKPLLGVRVHDVPDAAGATVAPGPSPLLPIFPLHAPVRGDLAPLAGWIREAIAAQRDVVPTFAPLFASGALRLPEGLE